MGWNRILRVLGSDWGLGVTQDVQGAQESLRSWGEPDEQGAQESLRSWDDTGFSGCSGVTEFMGTPDAQGAQESLRSLGDTGFSGCLGVTEVMGWHRMFRVLRKFRSHQKTQGITVIHRRHCSEGVGLGVPWTLSYTSLHPLKLVAIQKAVSRKQCQCSRWNPDVPATVCWSADPVLSVTTSTFVSRQVPMK